MKEILIKKIIIALFQENITPNATRKVLIIVLSTKKASSIIWLEFLPIIEIIICVRYLKKVVEIFILGH